MNFKKRLFPMVLANFGLQLLECLFGLMFGDSDFAVLWAVLILIIAGLAVLHYFLFEKPHKNTFPNQQREAFWPSLFACWHPGRAGCRKTEGGPMQPQKSQEKTFYFPVKFVAKLLTSIPVNDIFIKETGLMRFSGVNSEGPKSI